MTTSFSSAHVLRDEVAVHGFKVGVILLTILFLVGVKHLTVEVLDRRASVLVGRVLGSIELVMDILLLLQAGVQLECTTEGIKWRVRHQLGAVSNVQEGHLEPDGYLVDIAI